MTTSCWTPQHALALYNIAPWSEGYVQVAANGHLLIQPDPTQETRIDLYEICQTLSQAGQSLPVLVRFLDILQHRLTRLHQAFQQAMQQQNYRNQYTAIYPIKVNQQRCVVETIINHPQAVGLEVGSKPELMIALGCSKPGGIIVCNGYKDREYIRLALMGMALGHTVYLVIENPADLDFVLSESQDLKVQPRLGLRVRLATIGAGNWQNTGGEKSKFGLSATQVLQLMARLQQLDWLPHLHLLHFHLGSQIANIRDIQTGVKEACRYFAELRRAGAPIQCVDVGGGLGVDYEGTRSRSFCSINYTVQEYAAQIVHAIGDICAQHDLPHPHIFTESGRAMTAHHAILVTNVTDVEYAPSDEPAPPQPTDPRIVHDLWQDLMQLEQRSVLEVYHEAVHLFNETKTLYTHGLLDLPQRAYTEQVYFAICRRLIPLLNPASLAHREIIDELNEKLIDKYFANFSLFQSLPDIWALEQIFPILPLHRLDTEPTQRAVLHDLTCDSDGRISHYVSANGLSSTLPLHPYHPAEPYWLGFFLVGAYQEILGDCHNLFGDTHAINVHLTTTGYELQAFTPGETVDDLLKLVNFDAESLRVRYRQKIQQQNLPAAEAQRCLQELEAGLTGYTYLED